MKLNRIYFNRNEEDQLASKKEFHFITINSSEENS